MPVDVNDIMWALGVNVKCVNRLIGASAGADLEKLPSLVVDYFTDCCVMETKGLRNLFQHVAILSVGAADQTIALRFWCLAVWREKVIPTAAVRRDAAVEESLT